MTCRPCLLGAAPPASSMPALAFDVFPQTSISCDVTTVFAAPIQRAVSQPNNATKIMLALIGLQDQRAGTSYWPMTLKTLNQRHPTRGALVVLPA